ncbi:MAG: TatD family hydrolase [bacterium]|nr:TatD family hydrolase [bacterium]
MQLVDAHCHLESEELCDRLGDVLADARTAGIVALVTCAVTPEEWPKSQALAERYPQVRHAVGIHPWFVEEAHLGLADKLAATGREGTAVAIGEIGLDRKIETPAFDLQCRVFEMQLEVARAENLPVVMHCRGAFDDLLRSIKRVGLPDAGGIVHAFSGSVEIAEVLVPYGVRFSLGGALSYRNSKKRARVLRSIYSDHLLLETDSPDMPPVEAPGKPNVPCNILYNLRAAAQTLGCSAEEVAEHTTRNAARVFGLEV